MMGTEVLMVADKNDSENGIMRTKISSEDSCHNIDEQKMLERNQESYFGEITKQGNFFVCPLEECDKKFAEKGNLFTHIRVHTGERPFKCNWDKCDKCFITLGNLKSHMTVHTGNKPFKCSFETCSKAYPRQCMLRTHLRTHTGSRPFECPYKNCGKRFNEKGNLKTHIRIHSGESPFACTFEGCDKAFKAKGHLSDHIKKHLNLKPHECYICHVMFERASTLKIHLHVHQTEKPYECIHCKKLFKEKGNMKTHLKIHDVKEGKIFELEANNIRTEPESSQNLLESVKQEQLGNLETNKPTPDSSEQILKVLLQYQMIQQAELQSRLMSSMNSMPIFPGMNFNAVPNQNQLLQNLLIINQAINMSKRLKNMNSMNLNPYGY